MMARPVWEKVSAIAAASSVIISILALIVTILGVRESSKTASQALEMARQANNIALKRARKPPAVEIFATSFEEFDFTNASNLRTELSNYISIANRGEIAIDGLSIEIIGIEPLTYPIDDARETIQPLPSLIVNVPLKTQLSPSAYAHIDMRLPIIRYLNKLRERISDDSREYRTVINVVLQPKAVGDSLPSGVPLGLAESRRLIKIRFKVSILDTETVRNIIKEGEIVQRVLLPSATTSGGKGEVD